MESYKSQVYSDAGKISKFSFFFLKRFLDNKTHKKEKGLLQGCLPQNSMRDVRDDKAMNRELGFAERDTESLRELTEAELSGFKGPFITELPR